MPHCVLNWEEAATLEYTGFTDGKNNFEAHGSLMVVVLTLGVSFPNQTAVEAGMKLEFPDLFF